MSAPLRCSLAAVFALAVWGYGGLGHAESRNPEAGDVAPAPLSSAPPAAAAVEAPAADSPVSHWGAAHVFHASYASSVSPVPLIRLHSWTVHITDGAGRPVDHADVTIVGGMPEHTHGFPTVPEVTALGSGDYRVDGLKFHMPGRWTVVLGIRRAAEHDTVRFDLEVR